MQMFLTRMVSGFICSKNSNGKQTNKNSNSNINNSSKQQQQPLKPNKKSEKRKKRSLLKTDSKKSLSELLKPAKEKALPKETPSTSKASPTQSTKVNSDSWKRSEKQNSSSNSISGNPSKSLRKKSPTWLKFPNTPIKIVEKSSVTNSTSVCRPGTLYSDVLFGAGSSSLVKIKTLTPRRNSNTAQRKLAKALRKCTGAHNNAAGSGQNADRELFPSLSRSFNVTGSPKTLTSSSSTTPTTPTTPTTVQSDNETDIVILSESDVVHIPHDHNVFSDISSCKDYNSIEVELIEAVANDVTAIPATVCDTATPHLVKKCRSKPLFTIDIPHWNFIDTDTYDTYPKFLGQFEDEHYLNAEKTALLGLKLALGNNANHKRFKF